MAREQGCGAYRPIRPGEGAPAPPRDRRCDASSRQGSQARSSAGRSLQHWGTDVALKVVQVVLVSLQLSLGAILTTSLQYYDYTTANSGINYWGSLFYLSSGAVSMLAEVKPSHLLVKVFLVSNVFSCLTSFIEFCLICKDIDPRSDYCYECFIVIRVNHISLAFLFIATVVQFSISAFLAVVSWRSLKHSNDFASEVCVVNNEYRYVMSPEASQATYNHPN